jgi:hypothetical protein
MLGLGFRLVAGLADGLVAGLVFVQGLGPAMTKTCWPTFALASLWLATRRRLPVHLRGFLDDAYRLGLLRIVGPVYQFQHAALQDRLAPPAESQESAAIRRQGANQSGTFASAATICDRH